MPSPIRNRPHFSKVAARCVAAHACRQQALGLASSLAFGLGTDTHYLLDLPYVKQDNVPDGGVPGDGSDRACQRAADALSWASTAGAPHAAAQSRHPHGR